jgi:hypothetical protein
MIFTFQSWRTRKARTLSRYVAGVALLALTLIGGGAAASAAVVASPATAHSITPSVSSGSGSACTGSSTQFCLAATPSHFTPGPNCAAFPDGNFWESTTDGFGNPISWTYANGSTPCVKVAFTAHQTTTVCNFWLYVPSGDATATFTLGWTDTNNINHTTEAVNENSVSGWSLITMFSPSQRGAASVKSLFFQDNNGQSFPQQLGWGRGNFGIAQDC